MINASWLGDKIAIHNVVNIGVAVAVPDGLLVPVVNNADLKAWARSMPRSKNWQKGKRQKLQPQEMTGNTFTISNLGMFDIEEFTAIINPPDACILAVGSINENQPKRGHRGWTHHESDPQLRPQGGGWGNRSSIPAKPSKPFWRILLNVGVIAYEVSVTNLEKLVAAISSTLVLVKTALRLAFTPRAG